MKRLITASLVLVGLLLAAAWASTIPGQEVPGGTDVLVRGKVGEGVGPVRVGGKAFTSDFSEARPWQSMIGKSRALSVTDGKTDPDGDGSFLCVMDDDSPKEGKLVLIDLIVEEDMTFCMGTYAVMPRDFEETIKCVVCDSSNRQVCGSKPRCVE